MSERVCRDCGQQVDHGWFVGGGVGWRHNDAHDCRDALRAALERVTAERDAAVDALRPFVKPPDDQYTPVRLSVTHEAMRRAAEIVEKCK